MKNIVSLLVAFILGAGASVAQYMCVEQGTVLIYTETADRDGKEEVADHASTVVSASTDEAGVVSVKVEDIRILPGTNFGEIKDYSYYAYNPTTGNTLHTLITADDYKESFVSMMVEGARNAGQFVSDSDISELKDNIKVKGEISLDLPAEPTKDAKISNKTMKMSIGEQSMSMNLWEGKYLGFEDVETPAGKFENCIKVSFTIKTTTPMQSEKTYCTAWYAKGVGLVKSIDADKKGKVISEDILKEIKK